MEKKEFNSLVYNNKFELNNDTKTRIKVALSLIGKGKKVLDVGCFDGFISEKIKRYGNEVTGLEISSEAIKICKERGIPCFKQDLEKKFNLKENSFDVVFAGEIIEHIYDTDSFLQEIKRVLKPSGFLVLTTPNIAALTRRIKLLFGINPLIDIGLVSPDGKEKEVGHIRYFTIESLKKLLNRNSFIIDKTRTDFILLHSLRFKTLGDLFPSLGWGIILRARIKK